MVEYLIIRHRVYLDNSEPEVIFVTNDENLAHEYAEKHVCDGVRYYVKEVPVLTRN